MTSTVEVSRDSPPLLRLEDQRLVRGQGRFVDSTDRPGQLWMRVVRSGLAHAELLGVNTDRAAAAPGVHAVLTASDIDPLPRIPVRINAEGVDLTPYLQPVLAVEKVRYVGEPVAVVLAESPYVAEDAAELVVLNYDTLPAVLDVEDALSSEPPALFADADNEAAILRAEYGDIEAAFESADEVVEVAVSVGRHSGVPLETRGIVAEYDQAFDRLTVWGATKVPHFNRDVLASFLDMPPDRIILRAMDAGGGFGPRGEFYPEDFLVPYLSRRFNRPVKWVEDRSEHLMATNHSREQVRRLSASFDVNGRLLGIRDVLLHDNGAYARTHGLLVPEMSLGMLPGPYRVPAYRGVAHCVVTNKTPCGTYRAPGRYEATFARERLLDAAAARLGIDPIEIRRLNLLSSEDLPHERPIHVLGHSVRIEVGDFAALLEDALRDSDHAGWVDEARELQRQGHRVGVGVACMLEKSGSGGFETVRVTLGSDGRVQIAAGSASLGQGVETVLGKVVTSALGLEMGQADVIAGDTEAVPTGTGSWASRSTIYAGSAATLAAAEVAEGVRRIAARELGCDPEDVALEDGNAIVSGGAQALSLSEVARAAQLTPPIEAEEPTLSATKTVSDLPMTYPCGVHIAQVAIDPETGAVTVRRYHVAYDVGRAIDREMVRGQLVGGVAQGIGGALLERFAFDQSGQPLATSFMDYLLPTAAEIPPITTSIYERHIEKGNPLGLRGSGEGGVTAAGAAIAAAVDDAVATPGTVRQLPLDPESVRRLCGEPGGTPQPS